MSGPDDECLCEKCGQCFPPDEMQNAPEGSEFEGVELCNDCYSSETP